jgi:N-glycosidase YbiA
MIQTPFYRVNEPNGFLSNFYPAPIFVEGLRWDTVEHFFQASKFHDEDVRNRIRKIDSPLDAAIEGRKPVNQLRLDWEVVKDEVMYKGVSAKFKQNIDLRKLLLNTGQTEIVEVTKNDIYWGDGGNGLGKNMLGKILMQVRGELNDINDNQDLILPPWVAYENIDANDMFWGMGIGEDYLIKWEDFFLKTNKGDYMLKFPVPEGWFDIYD